MEFKKYKKEHTTNHKSWYKKLRQDMQDGYKEVEWEELPDGSVQTVK